jgi:hypothetical protein
MSKKQTIKFAAVAKKTTETQKCITRKVDLRYDNKYISSLVMKQTNQGDVPLRLKINDYILLKTTFYDSGSRPNSEIIFIDSLDYYSYERFPSFQPILSI